MSATVDTAELRLALRALSGGGDGEAALASALEASADRGVLPRYKLPQVFAGLRRKVEGILLTLALLEPTADGTAYRIHPTTTPERIEAALADQARARAERQAARAARAEASPGDQLAALRARKREDKRRQREREKLELEQLRRQKDDAASGATPYVAPPSSPPVTGPAVVTSPHVSPPMSPATNGDMPQKTAEPPPPVTGDALAGARPAASDPPLPPQEFEKKGGRDPFAGDVTSDETPPASRASEVRPAGSLDAKLVEVVCYWAAKFDVEPNTASEASKATVMHRLREPHTTVAHILAAIDRAGRPGSWFRKGDLEADPQRKQLVNICGQKFESLRDEQLRLLAGASSSRSPSPPPASSPPLAQAVARWAKPPPGPGEAYPRTLPRDFFGEMTTEERENPQVWGEWIYMYEFDIRQWKIALRAPRREPQEQAG